MHTSFLIEDTKTVHEALCSTIFAFQPLHIVETGTHRGTGTTRLLLNALAELKEIFRFNRLPIVTFTTIEVNNEFAEDAKRNLEGTGVKVLVGLSVDRQKAKDVTLTDEWLQGRQPANAQETIASDHADPSMYLTELGEGTEDKILEKVLPLNRPLLCLDSAGSIGLFEFQEVVRLQPAPFLLFLDDVDHVKHYRSRKAIESDSEHWTIHATDGRWLIAEKFA